MEDPGWGVWQESPGVIISAAGKNTEAYKYPDEAKDFEKHVVPVCYASRERSVNYANASAASKRVLSAGGAVAAQQQSRMLGPWAP